MLSIFKYLTIVVVVVERVVERKHIKTFSTVQAMDKTIYILTLCILSVCVFVEFYGLKNKLSEHVSNNPLKNMNTFYKSISEAMDSWTMELNTKTEEIRNHYPTLKTQYQEPLATFNSSNANSEDDKKMFFVVTAIFNPASYKRRNKLYGNFVRHMNNTQAQLITIECIFPSLNQTEFQVTEAKNPWHIQLKSESVYWLKENLINIAVSRLPPHAKWVSWLDADIEFENPNWVEMTIQKLQKYTVVQMFETAHFLGPENEILRTDYSFGYSVVHNKTIDRRNNYKNWYPHPGYGWAMAVEDFHAINGLPYYHIVGSGDLLFAYSLINGKSIYLGEYKNEMHPEFVKMIMDNIKLTFSKLVNLTQSNKNMKKEIVGYLSDSIKHYWHGSRKNRHYETRWKILADHKFNFQTDATITEDGLLLFNPEKPDLQKPFVEYFGMRLEDFNETD